MSKSSKDSDKLLTEGKINGLVRRHIKKFPYHKGYPLRGLVAKAQRDLTARLKDAECQARVERIFEEIELHMGGDIDALKDTQVCMNIMSDWWQALKSRELKEGRP